MKYFINSDFSQEKNKAYADQLIKLLPTDWKRDEKAFDILFIIGGDGAFLKHAQEHVMNPNLKVVFINSGRLGFYSYLKDLNKFKVSEILDDKNYIHLDLIQIKYANNLKLAINDFSFYSNYTSQIDIYINDVLLQSIHGNGVLVTTPTGSTARNKSLGGAIILPNAKVFSLIEIEAINNRFYSSLGSPIVFNHSERIRIETTNYKTATVLYDGNEVPINEKQSVFEIGYLQSKAKFLIRIDDQSWVNKLNYAFKNN